MTEAAPIETPARPSRHPAWTYALFAVGLAACFGVLQAWVHRREAAARRAHRTALARAEASPGTLVVDPALPAGVVVVDLVPISPDVPLAAPATLRAGGQREDWAPKTPAYFEGLAPERWHAVAVAGPYVVEGATFEVPTGEHGGRVALRAIPVDPVSSELEPSDMSAPEKELDVDLTHPDVLTLRWRVGLIVVSELNFAEGPGPALVRKLNDEWKMQGSHRDVADKRLDQAIVRVLPTISFADILPVLEALLANTRPIYLGGETTQVPVFAVSVQPPRPPRPPPRIPDFGRRSGPLGRVDLDAPQVNGRLPPEVVRRILLQNLGLARRCYEAGLARNPRLTGRGAVRFVIGNDGAVSNARSAGATLQDAATVDCIARVPEFLSFPRPEGGIVTVIVPYRLAPL
jgi:hypothetical protein